jgi:PhnB protein
MQVDPYLNFDGRCEEAIEFYKKALGAQVLMLLHFKDMPQTEGNPPITPGTENKVMHARLGIGTSTMMMSDGRCQGQGKFHGISLSLTGPDAATAERYFAALSEGGQVQMPLAKTFFSPAFGMLADKFGVSWMVIAQS